MHLILPAGFIAMAVVGSGDPIHDAMTRAMSLVGVIGALTSALAFGWKSRWLRYSLLGIPVLAGLLLALPSRDVDAGRLRGRYVDCLQGYEGVPYVWGGESGRGIDCTGLPRRAFRDAMLREGLMSLNGRLTRGWLEQWWFDASAKAMAEAYRGYVAPLGPAGQIRTMNCAALQPGDLAITDSGVHCLVYLGDNRWIEADPDLHKVVTIDGQGGQSPWLTTPVRTYRWRELSPVE